MRRKTLSLLSAAPAVLLTIGGAASSLPAAAPPPPVAAEEQAVSVRLMFGLKRFTPMRWDGQVKVSGGEVLGLTGVHFEGRDAIEGRDRWLVTTRVTRYADSTTPRGYDPVHTRPYAMIPNGVVARIATPGDARVSVETVSGSLSFRVSDLKLGEPLEFLDDEASAELLPTTVELTDGSRFDDYPSLAVDSDGNLWASWISYKDRKDEVRIARRGADAWESPMTLSPPGHDDNFRTAIAFDGDGRLVAVWSGKVGGLWGLYARSYANGSWSEPEELTRGQGENLYHALASDARGRVHLVWQGFRNGKSEILHRMWNGRAWSSEKRVSEGEGDNWVPALAADSKGNVWVGWDGYEAGDFNVYVRRFGADGRWAERRQITRSPTFDANVSLTCDGEDRLWIAYDHGEANWGKDWTSQRFKPGGGAGLYRVRSLRIAVLDGGNLRQPVRPIADAIPAEWQDYYQQARLAVDRNGAVWALGRSLTSTVTRVNNNWGAGGRWEAWLTRLDSTGWTKAVRLDGSAGRNDVWPASAIDAAGRLWFAFARDGRPFGGPRPINRRNPSPGVTSVAYTVVDPSDPSWKGDGAPRLMAFQEAAVAAKPVHANEPADVSAMRSYRYEIGGVQYRILRGDLHRHTDISGDGIGDGALIDFYRYAFTAGQYDFMMVGDHQYGGSGAGLEYNWWRTEKSEDVFLVPGRFWPLFGTERSLPYPNGHRNTVFATRGIRELPIERGERAGQINTGSLLYPYLRRNGGITTSHTSGTDQGTDWRDSDEELEPIVEIYQGLHASYEYVGAPRAATPDRRYYHHGDAWRPKGFIWEAWAKGIKLGVQASSDHIATHDAYACILVEADKEPTRQDLIDAMKARRTYAATDNIIVDFRIGDHLMGEAFTTTEKPVLKVKAIGTVPLSRIVVIKNNEIVHTVEPDAKQAEFEYRDEAAEKGENYYYVRVEQSDGSLAWSSPIWAKYR